MDLKILEAKHPEVVEMETAWRRAQVLVEEKESSYTDPLFFMTLPNESETQKLKRKAPYLMGFFNPAQELVSTKGEYILRSKIDRNSTVSELMAFVARADKSGQSLNDFVKNQASPNLQAYGTVFGVIDKPRGVAVNKADELKGGMPYLCILHPLQVRNWAWGEDGELLWFRYIKGLTMDLSDPFADHDGKGIEYVTWTRTDYHRHDAGGKDLESFKHGFGVVPVAIQASFVMSGDRTLGKTTFFSSSRHLFMGNTHLSKANHEILNYGSMLAVHVNDWEEHKRTLERDPDTNLPVLTRQESSGKAILALNDMADLPQYIEKNIEVVDKANAQALYYFGLAAKTEATGQEPMPLTGDQAGPAQPQSGVAKAYDFQDMDACLFSHAQDLQAFEQTALRIVGKILKTTGGITIKYPTSFDVRGFQDKIDQIAGLKKIGFTSQTGLKMAMKNLASDLTPDEKEQAIIVAEIDAAEDIDPTANPDGTPKKPAFPR